MDILFYVILSISILATVSLGCYNYRKRIRARMNNERLTNDEEAWLPAYTSTPSLLQRPPPPYFASSSNRQVAQVSIPQYSN
jgi:hypothetical protein